MPKETSKGQMSGLHFTIPGRSTSNLAVGRMYPAVASAGCKASFQYVTAGEIVGGDIVILFAAEILEIRGQLSNR